VVALSLIEDIINISQITVPTLQQIYSLEGSDARTLAVEIQSIIEELPGKQASPLLTSNDIATQIPKTVAEMLALHYYKLLGYAMMTKLTTY
jgi:hypothetical protein